MILKRKECLFYCMLYRINKNEIDVDVIPTLFITQKKNVLNNIKI